MLKKLLIWISAIVLAALSGVTALGSIAKSKAPDLALSVVPTNGFAAEAAAAGLVKASVAENMGEFPEQADVQWNDLALRAFESEPIVPDALAVLALSRAGGPRGDLMRKSFALSRRQHLVTGWLIADSGLRADLSGVLSYYDTSLRTSTSAAEAFIPAMANALTIKGAIKPFQTTLVRNPPWAGRFWQQVVRTPDALENAVTLRKVLYNSDEQNDSYRDTALIEALASTGQFEEADQLYSLLSSSKDPVRIIRNSDFRLVSEYPPIDWQLISTGEYGANISGGSLDLNAIRNSGGLFARQLVKLPKTALSLDVKLAAEVPGDAKLYLELSCAEKIENKPTSVKIPLTGKSVRRKINNQGSMCSYYWLDITGRSADNGSGFDVSIREISLLADG